MIITNYPKDVTLKVNNYCRDLKIKFFAGDIFGYFGYSFMDLVKHDYVEEEIKKQEAGDGKGLEGKKSGEEPAAKKAKMVSFVLGTYSILGCSRCDVLYDSFLRMIFSRLVWNISFAFHCILIPWDLNYFCVFQKFLTQSDEGKCDYLHHCITSHSLTEKFESLKIQQVFDL